MKKGNDINRRRLIGDWQMLCQRIGERLAGTQSELRAASYIEKNFKGAGLQDVHMENFPCTSLQWANTKVETQHGRRWSSVPSRSLVGAPATPGGMAVEGEMQWLEMPENAVRLKRGSLRGRIAVIFGPLPTVQAHHRALVAAAPAAVIHVDDRLPFNWPKSDGVYPLWVRRYGMPTTVTVPYTAAWAWRRMGVHRARVQVQVEQVTGISQNVIGVLPGRDPRLSEVIMMAHHDTQSGNPGADDNASGVVCILELARLLSGRSHRRTLRFISFGTEEQLSVGSAAYVERHRAEMKNTGLVINFDSVASHLGHFELSCIGSEMLARYAVKALALRGLDLGLRTEVTPFLDNFPLNRAGVPSWAFFRSNFPGGRWQHHSPHDTLENVSVDKVIQLLTAVAPVVKRLAEQALWPFPRGISAAQRITARHLGRELYGF